jgi:hypothetical protein
MEIMKDSKKTGLVLVIALGAIGLLLAGSLDPPPGPPAPTMLTLQQVADRLHPISDTCYDNAGTNRFVDCGTTGFGTSNGTVKDMQTGLIWLKNANCFNLTNWADANIKAAALANGQCGLSDGSKAGDWRLPTVEEWAAINMVGCYPFPGGPTIPDKTGNACYLTGIQWATNVQSNVYWSSSTNTASPSDAWAWDLFSREVNGGTKTFNLYVWPVRVSR